MKKYSAEDLFIKSTLEEKFPDGKIKKLSSLPVYSSFLKRRKQLNMTKNEYLIFLGFSNAAYIDDEQQTVKKRLLELFPDGTYEKFTDIKECDIELSNHITRAAYLKKMTAQQYLCDLGFEKRAVNNSLYDIETLQKLLNEYELLDADLARLMDCSRENIRQKKNKKKLLNKGLWRSPLSPEEISHIVNNIVLTKKLRYFGTDCLYIIARRSDTLHEYGIIYRKDTIVKTEFTLPSDIAKVINNYMLDLFSYNELQLFDDLENKWSDQGSIVQEQKKIVNLGNVERARIQNYASKHDMSLSDYLSILDYALVDRRFLSEDEVLARIKKYADEDRNILLNTTSDDYQFFAARASRSNMSIQEFFRHYGYNYDSGRYSGDIIEYLKVMIRERYIVHDNVVYIPAYDPIRLRLMNTARIRNYHSLDDFIQFLGYERIKHKRELPDGYHPYDFSKELHSIAVSRQEYLKKSLEILANDQKQVYIDSKSGLYYTVFLVAASMKYTIAELLNSMGYERIFKKDLVPGYEQKKELLEVQFESFEEQSINESLRDLENIRCSLNLSKNQSEKIQRRKAIVQKMKDLYHGRCQLCSLESPMPEIIKSNGEIYAEVHHITAFHEADTEEELAVIDHYKNMIVLCPFHHKYVHLHQGGFQKLISEEDNLFLSNAVTGEKLKIYTNYHL